MSFQVTSGVPPQHHCKDLHVLCCELACTCVTTALWSADDEAASARADRDKRSRMHHRVEPLPTERMMTPEELNEMNTRLQSTGYTYVPAE